MIKHEELKDFESNIKAVPSVSWSCPLCTATMCMMMFTSCTGVYKSIRTYYSVTQYVIVGREVAWWWWRKFRWWSTKVWRMRNVGDLRVSPDCFGAISIVHLPEDNAAYLVFTMAASLLKRGAEHSSVHGSSFKWTFIFSKKKMSLPFLPGWLLISGVQRTAAFATSSTVMTERQFKYLEVDHPKPFVAHVRLNRPDKRNAINFEMWKYVVICVSFEDSSIKINLPLPSPMACQSTLQANLQHICAHTFHFCDQLLIRCACRGFGDWQGLRILQFLPFLFGTIQTIKMSS